METNQAIINSIFVMSQYLSDNTERESFDHELAQSIIELIDNYNDGGNDDIEQTVFSTPVIPAHSNVELANIYRDFAIDQMGLYYPDWEFDQWLAMDVFDLSLSIEVNFTRYIKAYTLEFNLSK